LAEESGLTEESDSAGLQEDSTPQTQRLTLDAAEKLEEELGLEKGTLGGSNDDPDTDSDSDSDADFDLSLDDTNNLRPDEVPDFDEFDTSNSIELDVDGDRIETLLQNAETIKVATSEGRKAVTDLEAGDEMLLYYEDVARHFGEAVEDPQEFIETAALLEDTGVAAYAGAATEIEDPDLIPPALSIHSVEGRHASFVRVLGGDRGFPNAFDYPLPRDDVEELIEPFIDD
jgi:hypothetical protein